MLQSTRQHTTLLLTSQHQPGTASTSRLCWNSTSEYDTETLDSILSGRRWKFLCFCSRLKNEINIFNMYDVTPCQVYCTAWCLSPEDAHTAKDNHITSTTKSFHCNEQWVRADEICMVPFSLGKISLPTLNSSTKYFFQEAHKNAL